MELKKAYTVYFELVSGSAAAPSFLSFSHCFPLSSLPCLFVCVCVWFSLGTANLVLAVLRTPVTHSTHHQLQFKYSGPSFQSSPDHQLTLGVFTSRLPSDLFLALAHQCVCMPAYTLVPVFRRDILHNSSVKTSASIQSLQFFLLATHHHFTSCVLLINLSFPDLPVHALYLGLYSTINHET